MFLAIAFAMLGSAAPAQEIQLTSASLYTPTRLPVAEADPAFYPVAQVGYTNGGPQREQVYGNYGLSTLPQQSVEPAAVSYTGVVASEASVCSTARCGCGAAGRDTGCGVCGVDCYHWRILPQGLIYRSYLAGARESRFHSGWMHDSKGGWIWDVSLGGRVGIVRYGNSGDRRPEGFQLDIEGAGLPRLDMEEERDVDAADFRFGIPLTWGNEWRQFKLAYYHLSSHLGDEYLLKHPDYERLNFSRDAAVVGYSHYATPELRFYAEAAYAFFVDVSRPWEFQFGIDYAPAGHTGFRGAPFIAVNAHLRQEFDFGGNIAAQAGWAWRRSPSSGLFRVGVEYFNGHSEQYSFFGMVENKIGGAIWYDY
jgi:hypothetical protein